MMKNSLGIQGYFFANENGVDGKFVNQVLIQYPKRAIF